MQTRTLILTTLAAGLLAPVSLASADTMYFDGSDYRDLSDSPFATLAADPGSSFWLEDFEDGLLNSLGLETTSDVVVNGAGSKTDSVDGDGLLDGSGTDGSSLLVGGSGTPSVEFTFNAEALGQLPTYAGLVWTDGYPSVEVVFEAFDADGNSLGTLTEIVGENRRNGDAAGDVFFGIASDSGISRIVLTAFNPDGRLAGMEVDHVQYGYGAQVIPLPPAAAIGLAGLGLVALRRRRKTAA